MAARFARKKSKECDSDKLASQVGGLFRGGGEGGSGALVLVETSKALAA